MNVLHFVPWVNYGGSSLAVLQLAKFLDKKGVKQNFISCARGGTLGEFLNIGFVHFLPCARDFDVLWDDLDDVIYNFKPDLFHCWIPGQENPSFLYKINPSIPKIVNVLCAQTIGFDPRVADKIVFSSKYSRALSHQLDDDKTRIIRFGIEDKITRSTKKVNKQVTLGRCTAFCPSKKVLDSLECARRIPDSRWIIIGEILDGAYHTQCWEFKQKHNLDNVEFYTNIDNCTKDNLLSEVDIYHIPTSNETFCFSALEAMRAGKPIITYDNSAMGELDHFGNLILVNTVDIDGLVRKTKELCQNRDLIKKFGTLNRETYVTLYSQERYGKNMLDLYEEVISLKNGQRTSKKMGSEVS